jgi:hypothetical protein
MLAYPQTLNTKPRCVGFGAILFEHTGLLSMAGSRLVLDRISRGWAMWTDLNRGLHHTAGARGRGFEIEICILNGALFLSKRFDGALGMADAHKVEVEMF